MESFTSFCKRNKVSQDRSSDFLTYFYQLMKAKDIKPVDIYKPMNMSRQTYSKIISKQMEPSLTNAVKLAIGLKCSNLECKTLLKKLGYTLSSSSTFALVIRYCLENKIYSYFKINELLVDNHCPTLD
ncbi:MAG: helix-turn-helix transcriptional regulator [Bacilli bacterium]|nr:helix-turn-helix transcriptional regulator [Bacilli bacterium]